MLTLPLEACEVTLTDQATELLGPWRLDRPHWKARRGLMWIRIPGLAEYTVRDGRQVEIYPLSNQASALNLQHFLLSTPLAAISLQRGEIPLHAATLVSPDNNEAILLCAHSGTGKSTTAAALCQQGWRLMNDDISRLSLQEGSIQVWPGVSQIRLWPEACDLLELNTEQLAFSQGMKKKLLWQPEADTTPRPVRAIIELVRPRKEGLTELETGWQTVNGSAAIGLLKLHTFRPPLIAALEASLSHFQISAQLAQQVTLERLTLSPELTPQQVAATIAGRWI